MSKSNIKSFELESFKNSLLRESAQKMVDDHFFADAIYTAISKFGIDEDQFRDAFGLSNGAVERWMQGKNLPQQNIRPKIILWIKNQLQ